MYPVWNQSSHELQCIVYSSRHLPWLTFSTGSFVSMRSLRSDLAPNWPLVAYFASTIHVLLIKHYFRFHFNGYYDGCTLDGHQHLVQPPRAYPGVQSTLSTASTLVVSVYELLEYHIRSSCSGVYAFA